MQTTMESSVSTVNRRDIFRATVPNLNECEGAGDVRKWDMVRKTVPNLYRAWE